MSTLRRVRGRQRRSRLTVLAERDGNLCCWCSRPLALAPVVGPSGRKHYPPNMATVEHLTPIADGGTNDLGNLALSCARCNNEREHDPEISGTGTGPNVHTPRSEP